MDGWTRGLTDQGIHPHKQIEGRILKEREIRNIRSRGKQERLKPKGAGSRNIMLGASGLTRFAAQSSVASDLTVSAVQSSAVSGFTRLATPTLGASCLTWSAAQSHSST